MTTQAIQKKGQYVRNSNVEATRLDDELILLNVDQYMVTKLNEIGAFCWQLLQKPQTVDSLSRSVEGEFRSDSSREVVEKDIEGFLAELIQCGLIQNAD